MAHKGSGRGPATRLQIGTLVLVAAGVVDTGPVKRRLSNFKAMHRKYAGVQSEIQALHAEVRGAKADLARRAADADDAVEALALALANEGQPRHTPFAAFGAPAPWVIRRLRAGQKAAAIHRLVASIQRNDDRQRRGRSPGQGARDAALAAERAARHIEAAVVPIDSLRTSLRHLRYRRDAVGLLWDKALVALRREARSAADDGMPGVHSALFGWRERPSASGVGPRRAERL